MSIPTGQAAAMIIASLPAKEVLNKFTVKL